MWRIWALESDGARFHPSLCHSLAPWTLDNFCLKCIMFLMTKVTCICRKSKCRELLYKRKKNKKWKVPFPFQLCSQLIILTVLYLYFSRPFSNIYEHTYTPQDTYMYGVVYFVFENYFNLMSFNFFIIILRKILVRFKGNVCKKAQSRSLICVYYHWL